MSSETIIKAAVNNVKTQIKPEASNEFSSDDEEALCLPTSRYKHNM